MKMIWCNKLVLDNHIKQDLLIPAKIKKVKNNFYQTSWWEGERMPSLLKMYSSDARVFKEYDGSLSETVLG